MIWIERYRLEVKCHIIENKILKIFIIILLGISMSTLAQTQEIENYFSALRNKQETTALSFHKKNESQYVKQLSIYLNDTLPSMRAEAYYLLSKLGQQSRQKNIRNEVVTILVRGWRDVDSGINGQVANSLTKFQIQDFNRTAVDSIRGLMKELPPYKNKLFKLV